jgi:hypothetical protein
MYCEQFVQFLAQEPEGPLPAEAAAHLEACPRCSGLRDDLVAIEVAAREWGSEELAPPPRVWVGIQAQLQAEGLIVAPVPSPQLAAPGGWLTRWLDWGPRLEWAGVSVFLMLVAAGLAGFRSLPSAADFPDRPATSVQVSSPALDDIGPTLEGNVQRAVASLSSEDDSVAASLTQNLRIVDNIIAVCEKTVREHPEDPLVREYLYGAYQQKADLLAVAMDRNPMETK